MRLKRVHAKRAGVAVASMALLAVLDVRADAQTVPIQDFSLLQSERSGALCRAVRDYEDPAAQVPGGKAWALRCRGWEVALGHFYSFDRDTARAIGTGGLWPTELAKRASCEAFGQATDATGLPGVMRANCRSIPGGASYQAYQSARGSTVAVAEGFAPLSDVIESGLKIITGAEPPPAPSAQLRSAGLGLVRQDTEGSSFVATADAAQQSADYLSNRAYVTNHGWLFDDAEQIASALTQSMMLSPSDRALALLNIALNISNQGRFDEAEPRFAEALLAVEAANNPLLKALSLNYQSLHFLNRRRSDDARRAAQQAVQARAEIARTGQGAGAAASLMPVAGGFEISAVLAASLNERQRVTGLGVAGLTLAERMRIQDAQAYYVMGMADIQARQGANARMMLVQADMLLTDQRLARSGAWLRTRVFGALASLDMAEGNAAQAHDRLTQAIQMIRLDGSLQGTPAEAALYLDLAAAEAASNMADRALLDYQTGFDLMRESRGTLGDSADAAARYFDFLIARAASDPANARQYASRFFDTAQIIVSAATGQTIARRSARLANSGSSSGVLERGLEDLRREITIKTANIRRQQDSGMYSDELRTADQADLRVLQEQETALLQQLIQSNPRYGQLISESATLDRLQTALTAGEIYVKTAVVGARGYGVAVTQQSARIYSFDLSRAQAQDMVVRLRRPFDAERTLPRFDVALSYDLFSKVFGPVQNEVRQARHLIYEPDGALISFPASAFIVDAASVTTYKEREAQLLNRTANPDLYAGLAWLGRNTEVSLSVSPTAFLQVRSLPPSRAARPFLGLGAPSTMGVTDPRLFSLLVNPRDTVRAGQCEQFRSAMARLLPEVRGMDQLIRAVGQRYNAAATDLALGTNFTDVGLRGRNDFGNYRVVFFGTHGLLPNTGDCLPEPALVTSLGPGNSDGLLDASEILDLRLDAELIVLAACNTGGVGAANPDRTGLTGSGEALGGLARDFIYAGGRSLVISQWSVDQVATVELMNRIFAQGASSQANALNRSQQALMDRREFSHPYFWAAFSLLGDGARPMV